MTAGAPIWRDEHHLGAWAGASADVWADPSHGLADPTPHPGSVPWLDAAADLPLAPFEPPAGYPAGTGASATTPMPAAPNHPTGEQAAFQLPVAPFDASPATMVLAPSTSITRSRWFVGAVVGIAATAAVAALLLGSKWMSIRAADHADARAATAQAGATGGASTGGPGGFGLDAGPTPADAGAAPGTHAGGVPPSPTTVVGSSGGRGSAAGGSSAAGPVPGMGAMGGGTGSPAAAPAMTGGTGAVGSYGSSAAPAPGAMGAMGGTRGAGSAAPPARIGGTTEAVGVRPAAPTAGAPNTGAGTSARAPKRTPAAMPAMGGMPAGAAPTGAATPGAAPTDAATVAGAGANPAAAAPAAATTAAAATTPPQGVVATVAGAPAGTVLVAVLVPKAGGGWSEAYAEAAAIHPDGFDTTAAATAVAGYVDTTQGWFPAHVDATWTAPAH